MEPSVGGSSSTTPHRSNIVHAPRTSSLSNAHEHGGPSERRMRDTLRRGHSDGNILESGPGARNWISGEPASAERETWMEFMRQTPNTGRDPLDRAQMATSRAAIMASDRRKRLAEHHEDYARRRAVSNLSFVPPRRDNSRQSFPQARTERPFIAIPGTSNSPPTQRTIERPLPRPPSIEALQNRRSREITLPRWQPDSEVSQCPICGTTFGLWYRRHHCRKCGRVVCASCSPHRITIPRQFIVHPPEDAANSPTTTTNPGLHVIDLTADGNGPHPYERPQSSDYKINPALGGGQEVRLCNPCVPDPNPLPHLPYSSPAAVPTIDSFARPDAMPSHPPCPSMPRSMDGNGSHEQAPYLIRRVSSGRSEYRPNDPARFDTSFAAAASRTSRRHSHAPRPPGSAMSPPGYSSIYGSAPDHSAHQRHLQALLQNHPSHRAHHHHASTGNIPGQSQYRPVPDMDTPTPRPAPQPQIREEDECPICHRELPPKGPDGSEVARESHISSCIEIHSSSSGPSSTHPPASAATDAAVAASAVTPAQASGTRPVLTRYRESTGSTAMPSASFQQRRRTAGMLVYHASEKDCVGEDGERAQECIICFVEYAVGDEMGRLECLCKFHKSCIRQWWDTKGPGSCPVHQEGT
ncbi:hypothetical protein N7G274_005181 [Stereocaulon virgatum]|uniref:RING-type E3 ubiquitin transferase n=1 Tax=Stereocaulon virgatum TaxID=373712 RepID=A0ABR4AF19_9LECA